MHLSIDATDGSARAGTLHTRRGDLPTPLFMPVGTRGAVRTLDTADLEALGARIVLGNTYHLMLRPGADAVAARGGLHRFMDWSGHLLTDSGGFQIFSLEPKVDEDGATFQSTYDGSYHHLGPERAVEVQALLGADIQMALDVCPGLPAPDEVIRAATERTHRWAARARRRWHELGDRGELRPPHQEQFGIVQGGVDPALRQVSARAITDIGFDGYALGGLSVGETREEMVPAIAAATELLPADQPRYLMGVGDPAGLVEGVANGIDLFDCVLPTRLARHGTVLTDAGRLNLRNARHATDDGPLDPDAACPLTSRYSRAYLRHLLTVHELTAMRILTLHNLWWLARLMQRAREAVVEGRFAAFRDDVLTVWGGTNVRRP
ncbi:MAG: tRNA guanosine(34) transglycosylase Tgt [Acidimicrobiales bacterium]